MSRVILSDGVFVEDYGRPYIVAEVNSSHNGDIDLAKRMIDAAVDIGCDCVKFQSWSSSSLYSRSYYKENPIAKRFVDKFSLASRELKALADYCRNKKIQFASTPYSEEEVDYLIEECNVPFIKIASMEINNPIMLNYIGSKKCPVVLSTGMSSFDEVRYALEILQSAGTTQIILLHCVSIYPTELEIVNLNNILGLRDLFPQFPIGFSDHTVGDAAAVGAVALGACFIEKHLTLDKSKVGMDNGMATEPEEFKVLVNKCRTINKALGTRERKLSDAEIEQCKKMRRSIVVTRNISCGQIISEADLYAKRPGTGIEPKEIPNIVGKRATRDIETDTLIDVNDISL